MSFGEFFRGGARVAAICGGALAGFASVWGCGERGEGSGAAVRPAPSASAAIGTAGPVSQDPRSGTPGSASAHASRPSSPGGAGEPKRAPLEGTWEGRYRAERASPTLAKTVKDRAWALDDGKRATGEGTIRIVVGRDGEVGGSVDGPLGPADLVGVAEAARLVASVVPRGGDSFAGVVEATAQGDVMEVVLRAADGTAETVRVGKASIARSADHVGTGPR